ncbi:COR domain-containing protein [Prosthecobacter sp.]|uniref:leucine-rich repeat domain-containing protein n=1 Tax=Prosthecobacter sp. TaxID=1965333 RepID=UPI0037838A55
MQGKNGTRLDLGDLSLTTLPPEVGQLTALTTLVLSGNQLSSLPSEIGQLTALTTLDLQFNHLNALPPEIGQLIALTALSLYNNQLSSLPPEIGQLTALTELYLYNNQLSTLPPEIGQLTVLTTLYLFSNQLNALPREIGPLTALTSLDLSDNHLNALPPEIGQLTALTALYLQANQLIALPPEIGQLTALTELNLSDNQLRALPSEIGQLTVLATLYFFGNQLSVLPPEIGQLTALTELNLSDNQLRALPSEIGQLIALTKLFLSDNQLRALPSEIGQLTALTALNLSDNQLSALPSEIGQLTALTWLDLRSNQLSALPQEIQKFSSLKALILEGNSLRELPEGLKKLALLQELTLHGNEALGLPLEVLGPIWAKSSPSNPPAKPAEILAYYFAQKAGAKRPLNEVKVLVVGESEVGKTSLIRQLRGESHNPKQDKTHGIERHRVMMQCGRLGQVRLNVWDFGGQDIMHATHQFFLTHRSVYVLVLDSRQNERQTRIDYWLRLIASYGGNSPVIVVCNKADQQVMQLNWTALQRDYPQITAFAREVCCYHFEGTDRRQGLEELQHLIAQAVERHVAEVDKPILTRWLDLKDELETDGRPYLTLAEYHQLANQRGITKLQDREVFLSLMHQLGSVLHFSEHAIFEQEGASHAAPAHVEELNVLDPGWVTGAIYKLLNDADLIRAGGQMDRGSMGASLAALPGERYPGTKKDFIIAMMRRFEICFAFDGEEDRWFLPDLLHKDEVHTGDWTGAVAFRYQYRVLPTSIIGRLMVRLHSYIARHCLWRTGAKFKDGACEGLVRSDPEDARVDIYVRGGTKLERLHFLTLIRGTLRDIHQSFSRNLGIEEWVPVPKHPEVYLEYERLLLLEERGTPGDMVKVNGKLEGIEITTVLNNVTEPAQRKAERKTQATRESGKTPATTIIHVSGDYIQGTKPMSNDINILGNVTNSQIGQSLTNCTNIIQQQQQGELKTLLEELEKDVQTLISRLPEDQKEETAGNLELLVKAATSEKPNRKWYSVSSDGLLEASKYVKDFTGNISGTLTHLGKLLWPVS